MTHCICFLKHLQPKHLQCKHFLSLPVLCNCKNTLEMLFELNAFKQTKNYNCHQVLFQFLYGEIVMLRLVWLTEDNNSSTDRHAKCFNIQRLYSVKPVGCGWKI